MYLSLVNDPRKCLLSIILQSVWITVQKLASWLVAVLWGLSCTVYIYSYKHACLFNIATRFIHTLLVITYCVATVRDITPFQKFETPYLTNAHS